MPQRDSMSEDRRVPPKLVCRLLTALLTEHPCQYGYNTHGWPTFSAR